jgi:hypothetical protein
MAVLEIVDYEEQRAGKAEGKKEPKKEKKPAPESKKEPKGKKEKA